MAYKTNNDILRVKYGWDYDLLLRAVNHTPPEKDFRVKRIILRTVEQIQKVNNFKIDFSFLRKFLVKIFNSIPIGQRLNITNYGPITMATK